MPNEIFDDLFDLGGGVDLFDLGGGANLFGDAPAIPIVYSANLRGLITRQVYNEPLAGSGITSDGLLEAYLDTLTINPEVARYDWSAMSVGTYATNVGTGVHTDDWTHSVPVTLISDTFALAGDHNLPDAAHDGKCWWITPDGTVVSAVVESETTLTNSNCKLIKFTTDPSPALARFPICTHASAVAYTDHDVWCFFQDLTIKLRKIYNFVEDQVSLGGTFDGINIIESVWLGDDIDQGSGRPTIVPTRDGSLVIVGTLATKISTTQNQANDISLDLDQITTVLAAEGETFEQVELRYGTGNPANLIGTPVGYSIGGNLCSFPAHLRVLGHL